MSRTPTLPPTDQKMWRKLVARSHPDAGGDHELCVWTQALREHVLAGKIQEAQPDPPPHSRPNSAGSAPERIPFRREGTFEDLTRDALRVADEVPPIYGELLRMLHDCRSYQMRGEQQRRGASYRQLAAIGHKAGMDKRERAGWYRVCETVPLADRHARFILDKLERRYA